jgi:hypothetical protein
MYLNKAQRILQTHCQSRTSQSKKKRNFNNAQPHEKRQMRVSKTEHTNHDRHRRTGGNRLDGLANR